MKIVIAFFSYVFHVDTISKVPGSMITTIRIAFRTTAIVNPHQTMKVIW